MKKSKQSNKKPSKTRLNMTYIVKLLRFILYHQETLVNMNFYLSKCFIQKRPIEKAATMNRFEYSPLGKELKTQTDIAKKQYQKLDDTFGFD